MAILYGILVLRGRASNGGRRWGRGGTGRHQKGKYVILFVVLVHRKEDIETSHALPVRKVHTLYISVYNCEVIGK